MDTLTETLQDSIQQEVEKLKKNLEAARTIATALKKSNDALKEAGRELMDAIDENKLEYKHCEKMRKALFVVQ